MMNDDILKNIEYLREKADVSYEEAAALLEQFDGNVMRVLVELERQGRVYGKDKAPGYQAPPRPNAQQTAAPKKDAKKQTASFISKAMQHRVVVESGNGETKKTIANLSAPYCAGATLVAPWLAVGSVALMFMMGYKVKISKDKPATIPDNVETFVDQTVSNIKQTASSFQQTAQEVKREVKQQPQPKSEGDDEGGEITIE
ncbi:MAG: hypothetical protein LBN04_09340 [Oscillospiraceae bacterium]|jgi:hypothetical protein|nr:hypothetical protein [Oscillospiraceae bacterium]